MYILPCPVLYWCTFYFYALHFRCLVQFLIHSKEVYSSTFYSNLRNNWPVLIQKSTFKQKELIKNRFLLCIEIPNYCVVHQKYNSIVGHLYFKNKQTHSDKKRSDSGLPKLGWGRGELDESRQKLQTSRYKINKH